MPSTPVSSAAPGVHTMQVIKRNGSKEGISFDKITKRIRSLSKGLHVDATKVAQKVIENIFDGVTTKELDELASQIAASMSLDHPDYNNLAGRIAVSNHQKATAPSFYKVVKQLYEATDITGKHAPTVSKDLFEVVKKHRKDIEDAIDYERDFLYDYFGFQTLTRSYLLKLRGVMVERIQHMWMRVALGIHGEDVKAAIETYHLMSQRYFTHATPTLFNSGTPRPQLSSCFLMTVGDSIDDIFKAITQCAQISKYAGGIGFSVHDIRAKNSHIHGTNGQSNGLVPMLKVFNHTARYVDQCIAAGTVYTESGPKAVRDVTYGDRVLARSGDFAAVIKVLEHKYDGTLVSVCAGGCVVQVTPCQQLLVSRSVLAGKPVQSYMEAADLVIGDCLVKPVPTFTVDVPALDAGECWLLGLIIRCHAGRHALRLTAMTAAERSVATQYFADHLIPFKEVDGNLVWTPTPWFPITEAVAYDQEGWPRLFPAAVHLPDNKLDALLDGVLHNSEFRGPLHIRQAVQYMLLRQGKHGVIEDIYIRVDNTVAHTVDGSLLLPVTALTTSHHTQVSVYDLEVEGASSYVSEAGVAHHALPTLQ